MFVLPFCSYGDSGVCPPDNPNNPTGCISYDGCYFITTDLGGGQCLECGIGKHKNDGNPETGCETCSDSLFNSLADGKIWDSNDTSTANKECPWKCADDWYKSTDDDNNDICEHCPNNMISIASSDDITDCYCPSGQVELLGSNGLYCGTCDAANNLEYDSVNQVCKCKSTFTPGNTDSYGILTSCSCGGGSSLNAAGTACECPANWVTVTDANGAVSCSQCTGNTEYDTSTSSCICKKGYYGTGGNCSQCPYGTTTTTTGATQKSDCIMTHDTRFCDANGENCMYLIP